MRSETWLYAVERDGAGGQGSDVQKRFADLKTYMEARLIGGTHLVERLMIALLAGGVVAAPVAAKNNAPILFTARGAIGDTTGAYLETNAAALTGTGYIFGGTTAVPQAVADEATAAAGGDGTVTPPPPGTVGDIAVTPTEAAIPASGKIHPANRKPTMKTLSRTGARAAAAKRRCAFSVPDCRVTSTMQNR